MRVSIEWFLLDNWLMNAIILLLAGALSGLRFRPLLGMALAFGGAIYALLALAVWPVLLHAVIRIGIGCVLAFGIRMDGWQSYIRAAVCVFISAFLVGGLLLAITYLLQAQGSAASMQGGVLFGTVQLRVVLAGAVCALLTPRLIRQLRTNARMDAGYVRVRVTWGGKQKTMRALVDTGNMLTEPITGLPVVLLRNCPSYAEGYPVRYSSMGGEGELLCRRADRMQVYGEGVWRDIDVMIAHMPYPIENAEAIIGSIALPPVELVRGVNKKGETQDA